MLSPPAPTKSAAARRLGRWPAHMAHGGRRSPLLGWQECSAGQMLIGKREHRTSNAEHPTPNQREKTSRCSRCALWLDVRRSMLNVRCSNYLRCHRTGRVGSVTDNPAPMAHAAWRWSDVMNSRAFIGCRAFLPATRWCPFRSTRRARRCGRGPRNLATRSLSALRVATSAPPVFCVA